MPLRKPFFLVALAGLAAISLFAVACGDDDDDDGDGGDTDTGTTTTAETGNGDSGGDTVTIEVQDNSFPAETTISAGQTVRWDFSSSSNPHSVIGTSDNATDLLESEDFQGSGTYEVTFDEAGTYEYQCGIHGSGMSGTIVVE